MFPLEKISQLLLKLSLPERLMGPLTTLIALSALLLVALTLHLIIRPALAKLLKRLAEESRFRWDNQLIEARVPQQLLRGLPLLVLYGGIPWAFSLYAGLIGPVHRLLVVLIIITGARALSGVAEATVGILQGESSRGGTPLQSFAQLAKFVLWSFALLLIISALLGKNLSQLLAGLGALTAVLMLAFRDSLLALVASFQIALNDYLRVGDWISAPKWEADGEVQEISLGGVKILNWDASTTVVHPYSLLQHSFKNWRSMSEGGARRIKFSFPVNLLSVRAADGALLEQVAPLFSELGVEAEEIGAAETNLALCALYLQRYLATIEGLDGERTRMARLLTPSAERGGAIEIYCFIKGTDWGAMEAMKAQLMSHAFALLPRFQLELFQVELDAQRER